jgi:hypothetical protein
MPSSRIGGTAGQGRRGGIGERRAGADRRDLIGPDHGQFRVAAGTIREMRHGHDAIPLGQAPDPGPEAVHDAGDVVTGG